MYIFIYSLTPTTENEKVIIPIPPADCISPPLLEQKQVNVKSVFSVSGLRNVVIDIGGSPYSESA